ncbi:MAG TPA: BTAD domain-containing putative transcriptional regulator [Pseudonocardiaceae bacterium]|jgi:DNA-binding SARP family transcriptional activator/Tfp pilus assembly protein PilF|nr:BTAD domain-containing putative transcriptional regulator [Pseudonocardiaceae bacterium]
MAVEFRLLGTVEAIHDGQSVDLGHPRQRAVLAALLVQANHPLSADQLVEYTWGENLPQRGRDVLYSYVSRLRTVLALIPDVTIIRRSGAYTLSIDPDHVDLHRFQRLVTKARSASDDDAALTLFEQALGLWRGEAFADLDSAWLSSRRDALDGDRYAAELDYTDVALRLGRHTELVTDLTIRTTAHPLDERVAGQLMLALYRGGRQADALAHYQQVRTNLVEELGSDPSTPLRELHRQILTADPALATPTSAAPPTSIPRQLPAAPRLFTGRSKELAALTGVVDAASVRAGTVVISAIAGAGGIGKTWLALHWAHQNLHRFPDGQLFVDLRGFAPSGEPVTAASAVRSLLDSLGVEPARIPVELDAQIGLYRSEVADKHILVVLDNAANTVQVAPLLPGSPTCTVLVTSRDHLTGLVSAHGAQPVVLDILTDAEARNLLVARLGTQRLTAEPEAVTELLAFAGGFPLALSILAGRATVHPDFPLADLVAELRDTSTRLGALDEDEPAASLPAVLSSSYNALSAEQARVFGLLGLAPGPDISLAAAANLTGIPAGRIGTILRVLERVSLVHQDSPGRFRMHDLVRLYAADQAAIDIPPDERATALDALASFYTHTAYTGDQLLFPSRTAIEIDPPVPGPYPLTMTDKQAVLAWFEAEHADIMAIQQWAVDRGAHATVLRVAWTTNTYHRLRGNLQDNLTCWQAGADAAEHLGVPPAQISANRLLGVGYAWVGRHKEGLDTLFRALTLAEQTGDLAQRAHTHNGIAQAWEQLGEYQKALEHATSALRGYEELGNESWVANTLNQVGWFSAHVGAYEQARAHCEDALALHRKHNDRNFEAATLDSLAFIAHRSGDNANALNYYRQALALFRELGNTYDEAGILDHIGKIHVALDEPGEARAVWRQALELYQTQQRTNHAERIQQQIDELG